ncbi:MAG: cytochrome oxidase putative small subunit CydP [Gallionella sp.]
MDKKLKREIIFVLLVKSLVIFFIWAVWFSDPKDEKLDAAQVSAQLFSEHIIKGVK